MEDFGFIRVEGSGFRATSRAPLVKLSCNCQDKSG